jgi:hypothetical protein
MPFLIGDCIGMMFGGSVVHSGVSAVQTANPPSPNQTCEIAEQYIAKRYKLPKRLYQNLLHHQSQLHHFAAIQNELLTLC